VTPYCLSTRDATGRVWWFSRRGTRTDVPARVRVLDGLPGVREWADGITWKLRSRLIGRVVLAGPTDSAPDYVLILDRSKVFDQLIGPLPPWWWPRWMVRADDPRYPRTAQLRAWITVRREVDLAEMLGCVSAPLDLPRLKERRAKDVRVGECA
jgi:hypothetical protein